MKFLPSDRELNVSIRATVNFAGLYVPVFVVQLNAIKNGIPPQLAFYLVRWTSTYRLRYNIPLLRLPS